MIARAARIPDDLDVRGEENATRRELAATLARGGLNLFDLADGVRRTDARGDRDGLADLGRGAKVAGEVL